MHIAQLCLSSKPSSLGKVCLRMRATRSTVSAKSECTRMDFKIKWRLSVWSLLNQHPEQGASQVTRPNTRAIILKCSTMRQRERERESTVRERERACN